MQGWVQCWPAGLALCMCLCPQLGPSCDPRPQAEAQCSLITGHQGAWDTPEGQRVSPYTACSTGSLVPLGQGAPRTWEPGGRPGAWLTWRAHWTPSGALHTYWVQLSSRPVQRNLCD